MPRCLLIEKVYIKKNCFRNWVVDKCGMWNKQISGIFSLPQSSSTPDAQIRLEDLGQYLALSLQDLAFLVTGWPIFLRLPVFEHLWRKAGVGTVAATQHFLQGPMPVTATCNDWSRNGAVSWALLTVRCLCGTQTPVGRRPLQGWAAQ